MNPDLWAMVYAAGLLTIVVICGTVTIERIQARHEREKEAWALERKAWGEERAALVERCTGAAVVTRPRPKVPERVPVDARLEP